MPDLSSKIIMASAGTGKTFQLTNRYLALLTNGTKPESVLATTFTRKAAGEILDRVFERLAKAVLQNSELDQLRKHINKNIDLAKCSTLLEQVTSEMNRMNIMTLDSLFMRLAEILSLELGVPPGWRIIDEDEDSSLRDQAIDDALRRANRVHLRTFFLHLAGGELYRSVYDKYRAVTNRLYDAYIRSGGNRSLWGVFRPVKSHFLSEEILAGYTNILRNAAEGDRKDISDRRLLKAVGIIANNVENKNWKAVAGNSLVINAFKDINSYYKKPLPDDIFYALTLVARHAAAALISSLLEKNLATFDLLALFDDTYLSAKYRTGGFRFDDVPRMLLKQVNRDNTQEIYYRLDGRFDHVLLDEFQDTSLQQYQLLEPLLDEILSGSDPDSNTPERSVFCVGDVKQSLYMWREAEPDLMLNMQEQWPELSSGELIRSYRSSQSVIDCVNQVFLKLNNVAVLNEHTSVVKHWERLFTRHETARTDLHGEAVLRQLPEGAMQSYNNPYAWFAARRVKEIIAQTPAATVGILVRSNKQLPQLMFQLSRFGIPASKEGGNPLTDAASVAALKSLLLLIDHPGNTAALYHVITSPLGKAIGLSDNSDHLKINRVISDYRQNLIVKGYARTIEEIYRKCAADMDGRGARRFRRLIDLACEFDNSESLRPSAFVKIIDNRQIADPGTQRVRVMTVHKAKGLQFDVVILPELHRTWQVDRQQPLIDRASDKPDAAITAVTSYPTKELRTLNPALDDLYRKTKSRKIIEEMSVLYVAMTRAIHVLEMIVPRISTGKGTEGISRRRLCSANLLRQTLGTDPDSAEEILWYRRNGEPFEQLRTLKSDAVSSRVESRTIKVNIAKPETPSPDHLPRRSPSSYEGGDVVTINDLIYQGDNAAVRLGSLIHHWCECIDWIDDSPPTYDDLLESAVRNGWDRQFAEEHLQPFLESIKQADICNVFSVTRYSASHPPDAKPHLYREWPFAVHDSEKQVLLTGRFDRLVYYSDRNHEHRVEIIDFKSDKVSPDTDRKTFQKRISHYLPQMKAYRRAASLIFKIPPERVTSCLVFINAGIVIRQEIQNDD